METSDIRNFKFLGKGWVRGTAKGHYFIAQVLDNPSCDGINGGRVFMLFIRPLSQSWPNNIVSYYKGWGRRPRTAQEQEIFDTVLVYLEQICMKG